MATRVFSAKLRTLPDRDFVYVTIPFSIAKVFRRKGRVPVVGRIDKVEFRSSVFPATSRLKKAGLAVDQHFLVVNQAMRKALKKRPGRTVKVVINLDIRKRTLEIPAGLKQRLGSEGLLKTFSSLPYTQRREYVRWVEEAESAETRERRLRMILLAMRRRQARSGRGKESPGPAGSAGTSNLGRKKAEPKQKQKKPGTEPKRKVPGRKAPSK